MEDLIPGYLGSQATGNSQSNGRTLEEFTQSQTKEIKAYWTHSKGAVGRTAKNKLSATGQW